MDFKDIVKVVRQENGSIDLVNADGNVFKNVPPVGILEVTQNQKMLQIRQQNDASIYIAVDQLEATQVLPNAEVPFDPSTSTVFDLLKLMRTSFFFDLGGSGVGGEVIFQEQDETTQTTSAIWVNRHTFSGELAAGTYQIDSYQDLAITNLAGSLQNGIFIDTVLMSVKGQVFQLLEGKQILNRYIYLHGGGSVQIDAAFRRFTAATFAECFFSNLIIKKIG